MRVPSATSVKTIPNFIFPLVLGAFTAVTYVGFVAVYTVQPTPFIDEIFHIPQAQRYCQGNFAQVSQYLYYSDHCLLICM